MARNISYGKQLISVPDDATDEEIADIINSKDAAARGQSETEAANARIAAGHEGYSLPEKALRYMGQWGQEMRDAVTAPPSMEGPTGLDIVDVPAGVADAAATVASSTLAPVVAGRMTAYRRATQDPNAHYSQSLEDLTWAPKTPVGEAITRTAGAVFKPVSDALTAGSDLLATGAGKVGASDLAQQDIREMTPALVNTALTVAGARGAKGTRVAKETAAAVTPDTAPITPNGEPLRPFGSEVERARRLGMRLLPSQVRGAAQTGAPKGVFSTGYATPGYFGEAFSGPDTVGMAIIDNQKRFNYYAAKDLGISEITPQALQLARYPHNAVFNEVTRALPFLRTDWELGNAANAIGEARRTNPLLKNTGAVEDVRDRLLSLEVIPTQKALDAIRSYRQSAANLFRQADKGVVGVEEAEQAAHAYRAAADALEDAIERQAGQLNPDLVPRLRDARTALAKIHNVEDVLDGNNVDPQALVKMAERYQLTGYLAELAAVAREFPETMRSGTGVSLKIPPETGAIYSASLAARRHTGHAQGPRILRDPFQNRFGREDPTFDPRLPPSPAGPSPIADYAPPDPDAPGGAPVMPPSLGGELERLGTVDPRVNFDALPPAEAQLGDLVAETPPMGGSDVPATDLVAGPRSEPYGNIGPSQLGGSLVDFLLDGSYDAALGRPPSSLDLAPPPADFTVSGGANVLDNGLDFAPDPDMASASIVRGGGEPGTVADTPALLEALLGEELAGRVLDEVSGMTLAPDDVRQPFTRPAPDLGEGLGTDFGELPPGDLLPPPPPRGPPIRVDARVLDPEGGPQGSLPALTGPEAPLALPPPQKRLPAPESGLGDAFGGSRAPDAEIVAAANGDEAAYKRIAGLLSDSRIDPQVTIPYLERLFPEYVGGDQPPHGNVFGSAIWNIVNKGADVGNIPIGELSRRLREAKDVIEYDPTR